MDDNDNDLPNVNGNEDEDEDEDDDDDEEEEEEDDNAEEVQRKPQEVSAARKYMAEVEANKARNKALAISLGLGGPLFPPPPPKKPTEPKKPKEKKAAPVVEWRVTRASASVSTGVASIPSSSGAPQATSSSPPSSVVAPSGPPGSTSDPTLLPSSTPSTSGPTPLPSSTPAGPTSPGTSPSTAVSATAALGMPPPLSASPEMDVDSEQPPDNSQMEIDTEKTGDAQILAIQAALPKEVEPWVPNVLDEVSGVVLGDNFVGLVRALVELERGYGWKNGLGRLATTSRPRQVGDWINNYRKATPAKCGIGNLSVFQQQWWAWWRANQPRWRMYDEGNRPLRASDSPPTDVSWDKLVWGCKEQQDAGTVSVDWLDAVADVTWVLRGLTAAAASK
ncbi:hypothetical protein C8F01DRAFT_1257845 [Mycena amicta]|nr:hypothetical protein C8F01DRAFT_1257845 [Mycena amicta]